MGNREHWQHMVGLMSCLRYLCLFTCNCVQPMLCFCFSSSCVPYVANVLDFPFLVAPSVFSNFYCCVNEPNIIFLHFNGRLHMFSLPFYLQIDIRKIPTASSLIMITALKTTQMKDISLLNLKFY
jgi:hypothetical protein